MIKTVSLNVENVKRENAPSLNSKTLFFSEAHYSLSSLLNDGILLYSCPSIESLSIETFCKFACQMELK